MTRVRLLLTSLTLGSSLLSFAGYTLFLKYLGTSPSVDTLFFASSVPLAIAGTLSGVLLYLLPPHFTRLSRSRQSSAAWTLGLCLLVASAAALVLVVGYTVMLDKWRLSLLLLGFGVVGWLNVASSLAICVGQARGAYLVSGTSPFVASSGLLIGALAAVLWQVEWLLLVGQLAGAVLSLGLAMRTLSPFGIHGVRRTLLRGLHALSPLKPHAFAIAMGTMAFTLFQPIDAALCALLSEGSVTIMAYALRVAVASGTAASLGAFAVAARTSRDALQRGGRGGLLLLAYREVLRITGSGLIIWAAFALGGHMLLGRLLYSSSLGTADLAKLLDVLFWILLGVGPMSAVPYLFRVFYSAERYRTPAVVGICMAPAYGVVAWLGIDHYALVALGHAYAAVWWTVLIVCLWRLKVELGAA